MQAAASCFIGKEQAFADSQFPGGHELLSVFTPERMAQSCADRLVGVFFLQVQNLGVLVDELGGDEVTFASHWCRAGSNFANVEVGGDAVFREIDKDRAADGE